MLTKTRLWEAFLSWRKENGPRAQAILVGGLIMTILLLVHYSLTRTVTVWVDTEEEPRYTAVVFLPTSQRVLELSGLALEEGDDMVLGRTGWNTSRLTIYRSFTVILNTVNEGSATVTLNASQGTTWRDLFLQEGWEIGEDDFSLPGLDEVPREEGAATLCRVERKTYLTEAPIPYETQYQETSLLVRYPDREIVSHPGVDGVASVEVTEVYYDGKLSHVGYETLEVLQEPENEIIKVYGEGVPVSDLEGPELVDGIPEGYVLAYTGRATGYSASSTAKGASGMDLCYGTCAINPSQIPYGTKMYITSTDGRFIYGYCIAADTGTALSTGHALVDLYYESYIESLINEVWQVNVYIDPADLPGGGE